jgi:hypothetical protein
MRKRFAWAALPSVLVLLGLASLASAAPFTPGSPGVGDPFFPLAGNGGYDVSNYNLALSTSRRRTRSAALW